ncbi:MAG TPA: hypothetical protein VEZ70_14255 [Allosphingosinicella sp.]|nr:hypothetical protein [Allosphingosinicella sp.]
MIALIAMVALASCAPRRAPSPEPAPPQAQPQPLPPVQTAPAAPAPGWEDAALAPGAWSYSPQGPAAAYGSNAQPLFTIRCEIASRRLLLARAGYAGPLIVRTSHGDRSLPAGPDGAALSAADPFLDAIVFSRGRFAVEAQGQARLVIPAWPEPARVVDECRG